MIELDIKETCYFELEEEEQEEYKEKVEFYEKRIKATIMTAALKGFVHKDNTLVFPMNWSSKSFFEAYNSIFNAYRDNLRMAFMSDCIDRPCFTFHWLSAGYVKFNYYRLPEGTRYLLVDLSPIMDEIIYV